MIKKYAEYVKAQFADFNTELKQEDYDYFILTIFNPNFKDRNLLVDFDEFRATYHFSFQHVHFEYENDELDKLVDSIKGFINGEYTAYQFFRDGKYSMGGGKKSCKVDLNSVESLLYTFFPDLTEEQIEDTAKYRSEVIRRFTYEEHKKMISESSGKDRERHLELFKEHDYRVGVEDWSGKMDAYKRIYWNGSEFEISDITAEDL